MDCLLQFAFTIYPNPFKLKNMAFCKPTYTVIRNGVVILNGGSSSDALSTIENDFFKFCPPVICVVGFADIAFDGDDWTITLTPETSAPYLLLSIGGSLVTPTPSFPATIPSSEIGDQVNIEIIGSYVDSPESPDDFCGVAQIVIDTLTDPDYDGDADFALPGGEMVGCDGTITFTVLHTNADSATIGEVQINIISEAASQTYVAVYCDGVPVAVYIYNLPEPVAP
jgi:hypothetical protein